MSRQYRDESWLRSRYHDDGSTQAEIAEECGVSPRCIRTWMNRFGIETRNISGENHGLYGRERDDETKRKISESMTGREFPERVRQKMSASHEGKELDDETREKIADAIQGTVRSEETKQKMSQSTAGELNPNWRGGYSRRYGSRWSSARRRAKQRDEVCQSCGHDGSKRRLEVHHIVPVRHFRKIDGISLADAHVLENLVLLCKSCHAKAEHEQPFPVPHDAIPEEIGEIYK